ncbi:MAG: hypothetical protein M1820_002733 [Bogoriella megaspora]|nr:MAG: hypothetical protein M1820_002733 [Bogoriella megaspora]
MAVEKGMVECGVVQDAVRNFMPANGVGNGDGDGEGSGGGVDGDVGLTKQQAGLNAAAERERVRQAGRRLVARGWEGRRFECVQDGKIVESSFAKGEWALRLRQTGSKSTIELSEL